jgi:predicted nucleotide-binding protein (sugar kinase/HSP70/actin superfamily)
MSKTKSFFSVATASAEGKVAKQLEACLAAVVKQNAIQHVLNVYGEGGFEDGELVRLKEMVKKKSADLSYHLDFYSRTLISVKIGDLIDGFIRKMIKEEDSKAEANVAQSSSVAKKKKMSESQPKT